MAGRWVWDNDSQELRWDETEEDEGDAYLRGIVERAYELIERLKRTQYPPLVKYIYRRDPSLSPMTSREVELFKRDSNASVTVYETMPDEVAEEPITIPDPVRTFEEAFYGREDMISMLAERGFGAPTPIQKLAWPILLSGFDLIANAQTGTGKTLAFLLPALAHIHEQPGPWTGPRALVLVPTRELALQLKRIVASCDYRDTRAVCLIGGETRRGQLRRLRRGADIILATPGRLCDIVEDGLLDLASISFFVLEETDRLCSYALEHQVRRLAVRLRPDRQTVMTGATWPDWIRFYVKHYSRRPLRAIVGKETLTSANTVEQTVEVMREDDKKERLFEILEERAPEDKIIIFVGSVPVAVDVVSDLALLTIVAENIHGQEDQWDRARAIAEFNSGEVKVMVATDVAARGIDIDGLSLVINYDMPGSLEEYVHRVGRTGRAGTRGRAITFFTEYDLLNVWGFIKLLEDSEQVVPDELRRLAQRRPPDPPTSDSESEFDNMHPE